MGSLPATAEATRFGKYNLVARLATGGMAELFLARLQGVAGFEKLVCIKRILPHLARDKQFVAMFLDEARIAARITHPNVCQVFELGELEGSYYLAMEYLEGVPVACFRRRDYYGEMPDPRLVAGIALQACEGLHHAHQLKNTDGSVMEVVHRDVSLQNLFVTTDGIVKVLDFGIAKIQDARVRTSTGAVKGTYAYMAPEQLRGERVDRRTDVFAMGIVMWEILTRRHLFKRETDFLTFEAITSDPIEDVCALRSDVPPALSAVIMTALSRDRAERFPTARMLGEAIASAIPPFGAPAISEELVRAFPTELAEQAGLIRVAREGGAFDLEVECGPAVGHGTELLTTPVSNQRTYAEPVTDPGGLAARATRRGPGAAPATGALPVAAATTGALPVAAPTTGALPVAAPATGALPVAAPRRFLRPLLIAALSLVAGGLGAYAYVALSPLAPGPGTSAAGSGSAVATVEPADARAAKVVESATGPLEAAASSDAALAAPRDAALVAPSDPADAAVAAAPVIDAGTSAGSGATIGTTPPDKVPPRPAAVSRPSGPPGFITIDSAPVYAVITIDGKSYGETPLVRIALPPGRHNVHAVAPSGATRDVRITIEAGKVAPASRIEW